jgi:hypothetical protein
MQTAYSAHPTSAEDTLASEDYSSHQRTSLTCDKNSHKKDAAMIFLNRQSMKNVSNILNLEGLGHIFKAKVASLPFLKDRTKKAGILSRFYFEFSNVKYTNKSSK